MGQPVCGTRHIVYYPTMYNAETLLDIHTRAHESMRRMVLFCGNLTDSELRRPLTGFGFPTVLRQLEHTIGAEVYWQTVVTRGYTEEATMPNLPDVAAIEAFRAITASATRLYLQHASETELNSARHMISDPGQTRLLRHLPLLARWFTGEQVVSREYVALRIENRQP